ncbi:MAG: hypothetical protein JXX14_08525, partial [Deltaproteobacteria bacterium]|nr:hypothetical protein [Deltaproteobacteria bacterium]
MRYNYVILFVIISIAFLVPACGGDKPAAPKKDSQSTARTSQPKPEPDTASEGQKGDDEPEAPPEGRTVLAYRDGKMEKLVESQAKDAGLTIIDLSNYWTPFLFSERSTPDEERKPNAYRAIFRKLANDWPYLPPSLAEAKRLYEWQRARVQRAKIAALREEGVSEADIRERLGLKDTG